MLLLHPVDFGMSYSVLKHRRRWQWASALSAAESYPTSEVRDSSQECLAVTVQERPEGATLHPRSGAVAERSYPASEVSGSWERHPTSVVRGVREKPPCARGQGWWPWGATLSPRRGAAAGRSHPRPRPGPVAGRSNPRSSGWAGRGGPRGAIPRWRSGMVVVRRYPLSKVRSNGCALPEQLWRDTPCPR